MTKELLGSYHYVSGKGVLQGDTKVFAARSGITSIGVIHVPCYKNSLTVWRKQLKKEIKRLDKEMEVRIREQEKALIEKYEKLLSDFFNSGHLKDSCVERGLYHRKCGLCHASWYQSQFTEPPIYWKCWTVQQFFKRGDNDSHCSIIKRESPDEKTDWWLLWSILPFKDDTGRGKMSFLYPFW